MRPVDFTFQGDTARPFLFFRAIGAPINLRATVFQGRFTRPIWEAFMALNNGVMRPSAPVSVDVPRNFCGSSNTGEDRRLMILQPMGSGPTVFKFDSPIPLTLPDAIRRALAPVVAPPVLSEPPKDLLADELAGAGEAGMEVFQQAFLDQLNKGETHEEHHRQQLDVPARPKRQPKPRKRRRHGKPAEGKQLHRAV